MTEWSSAYIADLPDGAFACVDDDGRHYPHHDAQGKLDLAHLRAALSRIGDPANTQCGKGHLRRHASEAGIGEGKAQPLKATLLDDDMLRLLAIPFSGPIPSPLWPRGVDLDGETFTERTDIKAGWFAARPVDWHHGKDAVMGREVIGKALEPTMEEDGWWVKLWLDAGNRRLALIRKLAEQGGQLFGSSEPAAPMVRVDKATGEILTWPYLRQALSTSPQNTHSVLRPLKAELDYLMAQGYHPSDAFWQEVLDALHDLGPDLLGAKAGRVDALGEMLSATDSQVQRLWTLYTQRAKEYDHAGAEP